MRWTGLSYAWQRGEMLKNIWVGKPEGYRWYNKIKMDIGLR
jgi:hypothetical protein